MAEGWRVDLPEEATYRERALAAGLALSDAATSTERMSDQDRALLAAACRSYMLYIDQAEGQLEAADLVVLARLEDWVQHLDPDEDG